MSCERTTKERAFLIQNQENVGYLSPFFVAGIKFNTTGQIQCYSPAFNWQTLLAQHGAGAPCWYSFVLVVNLDTGFYDVYVDGDYLLTAQTGPVPPTTPAILGELCMHENSTSPTQVMYVDDVGVYELGGVGWSHIINGVASPGKVNSVLDTEIANINGVT
jgi:hypothetical protein